MHYLVDLTLFPKRLRYDIIALLAQRPDPKGSQSSASPSSAHEACRGEELGIAAAEDCRGEELGIAAAEDCRGEELGRAAAEELDMAAVEGQDAGEACFGDELFAAAALDSIFSISIACDGSIYINHLRLCVSFAIELAL